jgi:NAD(P)H-dependent FMN reductase
MAAVAAPPRFQPGNLEHNLKLLAQFEAVAREKSVTPTQLALAWLMAQGDDIIPIPSSKSRRHLEENLKAIDIKLTKEELARLDEIMPPWAAASARTRDMDWVNTADGLLLVTPEYHNAMPGVGKNASAWLSRPPQDIPRVFGGRPVARMGATPGGLGTVHAQTAWLLGFRTLGLPPWFGTLLYGSGAARVFDASGTLLDEQMRKRLRIYMTGFAAFVQRRSLPRRASQHTSRLTCTPCTVRWHRALC